jgi:hypothetical protein
MSARLRVEALQGGRNREIAHSKAGNAAGLFAEPALRLRRPGTPGRHGPLRSDSGPVFSYSIKNLVAILQDLGVG